MNEPGVSKLTTSRHRAGSDMPFYIGLGVIGALYVFLILAMILADLAWTSPEHFSKALASKEIRYSITLSLFSCTVTALLSVIVAVPIGYVMTRFSFRGKVIIDAVLEIPVVLPPLVVGLSLLILFQTVPGKWFSGVFETITGTSITYAVPGVILAQFMVACAFAVRTMRTTFDHVPIRQEQVALTLGCSRWQAFRMVVLPQTSRGVLAAGTIAWARALGEFGPILIFAGATRMRTEVLSTTVFLELTVGNIESAVAVSILMVTAAVVVLVIVRVAGHAEDGPSGQTSTLPRGGGAQ